MYIHVHVSTFTYTLNVNSLNARHTILRNSIRHTVDMKYTILLLHAIDRDTVQGGNVSATWLPIG